MYFAQLPSLVSRTKRPGDLRKHCLKLHDEIIAIPRRPRRTDVEIVVKLPVVTQELDNYNSAHVTCASSVMDAPTAAELAVQDRFIEQMSMFQSSYKVCTSPPIQTSPLKFTDQTTWQDLPSFDWLNSQIDSSASPSPISTTASSTPVDSAPFGSPDWLMGALGSSKSHLLAPPGPLSPMHWPVEWEAFTFGI